MVYQLVTTSFIIRKLVFSFENSLELPVHLLPLLNEAGLFETLLSSWHRPLYNLLHRSGRQHRRATIKYTTGIATRPM